MRVTYSPDANVAYVYLREVEPGGARTSINVDVGGASAADFVLDLDPAGRLIGIEVIDALHGLPRELLEQASSKA